MTLTSAKNHVDVIRYFSNDKGTIGVWVFNTHAQCFTLEDAFRPVKMKGQTRIPAGLYELELKPIGSSRFDTRSWNMPPLKYYGMIRVKNVPGFEEILVHPGNSDEDTEGCILVGLSASAMTWAIQNSIQAYLKIYPQVAEPLKKGERVTILIQDEERAPAQQLIS